MAIKKLILGLYILALAGAATPWAHANGAIRITAKQRPLPNIADCQAIESNSRAVTDLITESKVRFSVPQLFEFFLNRSSNSCQTATYSALLKNNESSYFIYGYADQVRNPHQAKALVCLSNAGLKSLDLYGAAVLVSNPESAHSFCVLTQQGFGMDDYFIYSYALMLKTHAQARGFDCISRKKIDNLSLYDLATRIHNEKGATAFCAVAQTGSESYLSYWFAEYETR